MACAVELPLFFLLTMLFLIPAPFLGLLLSLPGVLKLPTTLRRFLGTVLTIAAVPMAYQLQLNFESLIFSDHVLWVAPLLALACVALIKLPGYLLSLPPLPRKNRDDIEL